MFRQSTPEHAPIKARNMLRLMKRGCVWESWNAAASQPISRSCSRVSIPASRSAWALTAPRLRASSIGVLAFFLKLRPLFDQIIELLLRRGEIAVEAFGFLLGLRIAVVEPIKFGLDGSHEFFLCVQLSGDLP